MTKSFKSSDLVRIEAAPSRPDPIVPGCSVRLRSGGPTMTVQYMATWAWCSWTAGEQEGFSGFETIMLRLVN